MILTCPSCTISYEIPIDLPEEGKKVRCAKCGNVWKAFPDDDKATSSEPVPGEDEWAQAAAKLPPQVPEIDAEFEHAASEEAPPGEIEQPEASPPASMMPSGDETTDDIEALLPNISPEAMDEVTFGNNAEESQAAPLEDEEPQDQASIDALFDTDTEDPSAGMLPEEMPPQEDPIPDDAPQSQDSIDELMAAAMQMGSEEANAPEADLQTLPELEPETDLAAALTAPTTESVDNNTEVPSIETAPTLKRRRSKKKFSDKFVYLATGWGALAACISGLAVYALLNSESVVSTVPGAARVYEAAGKTVNVRGLEFRDVSYSWEAEAGQPVLHVKGSVVNVTDRALNVPKVVFALRDDQGAELFHWTKNIYQKPLSAGQSAGFAARIPSPPRAVRSLQVRFAAAK